jgi:hypothetical protein
MTAVYALARFSGENLGDSLTDIVAAPNGRDGQRLGRWLARQLAQRREIARVGDLRPDVEGWMLPLSVTDVSISLIVRRRATDADPNDPQSQWELEVLRPAPGLTNLLQAERTAAWLKACWAVHDCISHAKPLKALHWVGSGASMGQSRVRAAPF